MGRIRCRRSRCPIRVVSPERACLPGCATKGLSSREGVSGKWENHFWRIASSVLKNVPASGENRGPSSTFDSTSGNSKLGGHVQAIDLQWPQVADFDRPTRLPVWFSSGHSHLGACKQAVLELGAIWQRGQALTQERKTVHQILLARLHHARSDPPGCARRGRPHWSQLPVGKRRNRSRQE